MGAVFGRCDTGTDPMGLAMDGDALTVAGRLSGTSLNHLNALVQQMRGLDNNPDESVIPCTFSHDSMLDGFYQVSGASVEPERGIYYERYNAPYSLKLQRVTGYANPWFEVTTQSLVRTNGHAVTAPPAIIGTYLTIDGYFTDMRPNLTAATDRQRVTQTGGATNALQAKILAAPTALTQYRFATSPAKFYVGACTVEAKYGSTWYPVTGRSFPAGCLWRIANDYVRLTAATTASTSGTFEVWDNTAAAWESVTVAHWDNAGGSHQVGVPSASGLQTPSVLRNSPEHVVVKVVGQSFDFSYSLQRGHGQVTTSFTAAAAAPARYGTGFGTGSTAACTAFTGGARQTASNASGNRMVFGTAAANTNDLVNGATYLTAAATSGSAWWGVDLGGLGLAAATDLRDEFLGAVSWRQTVIVR